MRKISLFFVIMLVVIFMCSSALSKDKKAPSLSLTEIELLTLQKINLELKNLRYEIEGIQRKIDKDNEKLIQEKKQHIKKIEARLKVKLDGYVVADDGILIKRDKRK